MGTKKPTLGEQVRSAREKAGLTQPELAHELGLRSNSYLSRVENDVHPPSIRILEDIAVLADVDFIIYARKWPGS